MINRILDNYFLIKITKTLIDVGESIFYLDFYCIKDKYRISIYANYRNIQKRLVKSRCVYTIYKNDIISFISNYGTKKEEFKKRVKQTMYPEE